MMCEVSQLSPESFTLKSIVMPTHTMTGRFGLVALYPIVSAAMTSTNIGLTAFEQSVLARTIEAAGGINEVLGSIATKVFDTSPEFFGEPSSSRRKKFRNHFDKNWRQQPDKYSAFLAKHGIVPVVQCQPTFASPRTESTPPRKAPPVKRQSSATIKASPQTTSARRQQAGPSTSPLSQVRKTLLPTSPAPTMTMLPKQIVDKLESGDYSK